MTPTEQAKAWQHKAGKFLAASNEVTMYEGHPNVIIAEAGEIIKALVERFDAIDKRGRQECGN